MLDENKLNKIIGEAFYQTITTFKEHTPPIYDTESYGAVWIAPSNLVAIFIFESNEDLSLAYSSGLVKQISEHFVEVLRKHKYPVNALANISLRFESYQQIKEESGGNYRYYFQ